MTDKIIVGNEYIFRIKGNRSALRRVSLGTNFKDYVKHEGKQVTIQSVGGTGKHQEIYVSSPSEINTLGFFWPPECFQPMFFEFIVGHEYVCDKRPDGAHGTEYGWGVSMDEAVGMNLTCVSIIEGGAVAELEDDNGDTFYYYKKWVRPDHWIKVRSKPKLANKVDRKDLFHFWPGDKK